MILLMFLCNTNIEPRQNITMSGEITRMTHIGNRKYALTPGPESWNGARKAYIRIMGSGEFFSDFSKMFARNQRYT